MLWRKKWPSALSGARLGNLVATGTGLQVRWGNFMSLLSVVRHLSTDLYICKFSKGHGVSIMEMDAKSPAPQLWMPFSWSDIACGRWTSSSPHLFVWLSAAKHRPLLPHWCLPCMNHSFSSNAILTFICGIPFSPVLCSSLSTCTRHLASKWCCWPGTVIFGHDEWGIINCGYITTAIFNHLPFAQLQCCHISSVYLKINIHETKNEGLWF